MDNVTHTIIGAAFARSLPERFRRPEIYWASVIANNLPDSDVLVRWLPGATSLDSLVQHRGFTHTVLAAPILGLVSAGIAKRLTRADRWTPALIVVGISGILLHVGADFLNSYGVHPFTPFLDRWYYGDTLFIVEPLVWFSLLPFVAREADRSAARIAWAALAIAMLVLVWIFPTFPRGLSESLTLFLAVSTSITLSVRRPLPRRTVPIGILATVLVSFAAAGNRARSAVRSAWESAGTGETPLSIGSSPGPGNPVCWSVGLETRRADARLGDEYLYRAADVSLLPSVLPPSECAAFTRSDHTAEYSPPSLSSTPSVRWDGDVRLSVESFDRLRARSARFRRLLSFARFPFFRVEPDGRTIAGDLRYDRERGIGFSEIEIPADENVPVPAGSGESDSPWEPPFRVKPDADGAGVGR